MIETKFNTHSNNKTLQHSKFTFDSNTNIQQEFICNFTIIINILFIFHITRHLKIVLLKCRSGRQT